MLGKEYAQGGDASQNPITRLMIGRCVVCLQSFKHGQSKKHKHGGLWNEEAKCSIGSRTCD